MLSVGMSALYLSPAGAFRHVSEFSGLSAVHRDQTPGKLAEWQTVW